MFSCKVNKLTSNMEENIVTSYIFYVFLAKMVGKHAKIKGFWVDFPYLTEQTDIFSIKLSIFANNSAKEPQIAKQIMQFRVWLTSRAATILLYKKQTNWRINIINIELHSSCSWFLEYRQHSSPRTSSMRSSRHRAWTHSCLLGKGHLAVA